MRFAKNIGRTSEEHVTFESKKINDQTDSIRERDKGDAERRKIGINNTAKRTNKKVGWLVKSSDVKKKTVLNVQLTLTMRKSTMKQESLMK